MIQTTPLSQRDPKWANIKLGFGTGTIGQFGCTITAITMLLNSKGANLTVDKVNQTMKDKGAFGGDPANLVWWAKLPQAFPQITSVYKYYSYDNEVVKGLINQGYPVVVCVDGSPIGASQHWVLYVGDQTLLDPWDGKGKPTSTYKPLEFVSMGVIAPKPVETETPLQACLKQHGELVTEIDNLKRTLALTEQDNKTKQAMIDDLKNNLSASNSKIKPLEDRVTKLETAIGKVKEGLVGV